MVYLYIFTMENNSPLCKTYVWQDIQQGPQPYPVSVLSVIEFPVP